MPEAVIVDAVRTPIGRAAKGSLKAVRADDLAAIPLRALIERNPELEQSSIVDVMMGCGYGERESGYNIGRIATLLAGIDYHVPGCTVNRFCASSLQTARMAFHAIRAGEGDTYIAAGVEAVSRTAPGAPFEFHPKLDGSPGSLYNAYIAMGLTAENVAEQWKVSREAQDEWALISQTRAVAAQESGHFDREIVPVPVPAHTDVDKEGNEVAVPATVEAMIRARGLKPSALALSSLMISSAAAPSLSGQALPAVTVPPSLNTGRRPASASMVVPGLGPSSFVMTVSGTSISLPSLSRSLCAGTVTGTISLS